MIEVHSGSSRLVILTRRHALKLPHPGSWRRFLRGLLANMQEAAFGRLGWPEVCPVLWAMPGGWLVVMPRATCLTTPTPFDEEYHARLTNLPDRVIPAENKASSWGYLGGRLVAVDYG